MSFDVAAIKSDFPILKKEIRDGKRLVYLDSAATSQKPFSVLDSERDFYLHHNAAVHRGAHQLAEEATDLYEGAREKVATFLGAKSSEIIFTKSATESLNAIAYSIGNASITRNGASSRFALGKGDEILVTEMEHHANLVPWQELSARTGATLRWIPITPEGRLDLSQLHELINSRTKIVAITHESNVLGSINPIEEIAAAAHKVNALVVVDACQSVPHLPVNVASLGADLLAFSGHKMVGPTGVGILWGREEILNALPPFLYGGSMVESVSMDRATYLPAPRRFEAGVPNMAQAVGLGAAVDYLSKIGMEEIHAHESELTARAIEGLSTIEGLTIVGPKSVKNRGGIISFAIEGIHPHDLGQVLDSQGIAVRTGHHCAWPLMRKFDVVATTRASFYIYNDLNDVQALIEGVESARDFFMER